MTYAFAWFAFVVRFCHKMVGLFRCLLKFYRLNFYMWAIISTSRCRDRIQAGKQRLGWPVGVEPTHSASQAETLTIEL